MHGSRLVDQLETEGARGRRAAQHPAVSQSLQNVVRQRGEGDDAAARCHQESGRKRGGHAMSWESRPAHHPTAQTNLVDDVHRTAALPERPASWVVAAVGCS